MPLFCLFALTYLAITALASSTDLSRYESLADCLASHSVPTLIPASPNYTTAILPYNLRTPWTPLLLAIPSSAPQVSAAVSCSSKYNLKIAARSGGHSYAAYGLGGHNGSLVVDLKQFAKLQVDNETGIVEIGAGNRLGNIALGLYAQGRRALPHGLCPG
jgi:FAD/FMN-containing dehydrogenase